jgi:hypothetical protein
MTFTRVAASPDPWLLSETPLGLSGAIVRYHYGITLLM